MSTQGLATLQTALLGAHACRRSNARIALDISRQHVVKLAWRAAVRFVAEACDMLLELALTDDGSDVGVEITNESNARAVRRQDANPARDAETRNRLTDRGNVRERRIAV